MRQGKAERRVALPLVPGLPAPGLQAQTPFLSEDRLSGFNREFWRMPPQGGVVQGGFPCDSVGGLGKYFTGWEAENDRNRKAENFTVPGFQRCQNAEIFT